MSESLAPRLIDLSWIVPLFRNGEFCAELAQRVADTSCKLGLSWEVVFVDDACPQRSADLAAAAALARPGERLQIVRLPRNQGQDAALRAGLRIAAGGHAVLLDGDLQDPPEAVLALWSEQKRGGWDAVFAARQGSYESVGRLATSRIYRAMISAVGGLPRRAGLFVLLGPRGIQCAAAGRVPWASLLAALAARELRKTSIMVERSARPRGRSAYTSWRRLKKGVSSVTQAAAVRWFGCKF